MPLFISCSNTEKVVIEDKTYSALLIDDKLWMIEPININHKEGICFDNLEENCVNLGRLYNWETALAIDEAVVGWRLPTKTDIDTLRVYNEEWFEAIEPLGGWFYNHTKSFYGKNNYAFYWTSTLEGDSLAWNLFLNKDSDKQLIYPSNKNYYRSVILIEE